MDAKLWKFLRALLFLLLFIIVITEITIIFAYNAFHNRTFPHVSAAEVPIGLLTEEAAREKLATLLQNTGSTPITLEYLGHSREFLPNELGITLVNLDEMLQMVPKMDLSPSLILKPREFFDLLQNIAAPKRISIVKNIDIQTLSSALKNAFPDLFQEKRNAFFTLKTTRELAIEPELEGRSVDIEAIFPLLIDHINHSHQTPLSLVKKSDRPIFQKKDLEPYLNNFQKTIESSLSLYFENITWDIAVKELSQAIFFEYDLAYTTAKSRIPLSIPDEKMPLLDRETIPITVIPKIRLNSTEKILEKIGKNFEIEPQNIEISLSADGKALFNGTAVNGRKIQTDSLVKVVETALDQGISRIALPVKKLKAEVSVPAELKEKGITELIATGYSNFSGSPANRIHNIKTGISKFNGLLVAPGETFSFNEHLGEVDESTGYKKELVIREGNTIPEFGGGLCQVSSTLFRAILFGGLPIVERKAHSYAVVYYARPLGYGLDATIYPPDVDLKFKNDTPGYILIQAYTDGEDAYFKFYGTSDGRTVEMDGPYIANKTDPPPDVIVETDTLATGERKKVDSAHEGFEATWYRTVKKPSVAEKDTSENTIQEDPVALKDAPLENTASEKPSPEKETIFSRYKAWPNKYLVGKEKKKST